MILGIIGPLYSAKKINEVLKKIDPSLDIKLYIREKVVDTAEVIEECENECDAIMFTGRAVYEYVSKQYSIKKPNSFVSKGGTSIVKAFWEIRNANINTNRFSIDVVESEALDDVIIDFDIDTTDVFYLPFSADCGEQECIKWHVDLYEKNKIDVIITGYVSIYNDLKAKGYPVFLLQPTIPLIKVCYDKIKSAYALSIAKHSQIAVEILSLNDYNEDMESYYTNMIKRSDMDKFIVDYVRSIQGSIFSFGSNEYIIFAHKGAVYNEYNYGKLSDLKKNVKLIGFSLNIGIGVGITAYQAETNARKALRRSKDSKDQSVFIVKEDNSIVGPLGTSNEIKYQLVATDENIINLSKKIGLSCESIAKIIGINEARKSKVYDAKELAGHLDISERSARRILNKIVQADFGRIYAKETSKGGGRPKNLIEIMF